MRAWYTVGVIEPVAYSEKRKPFSVFSAQVGGAMVRGAYQGTDPSSSPVFPDHQAYQLPHKPAASGGEQLSAELLHRTRCCHPAWRQRETHAGPLQDAHDRYQRPERQRGGAFWCGRSIQTRRGGQWLLWQTPLWGDGTPEWKMINGSVNVLVHNMRFNAPGSSTIPYFSYHECCSGFH